jgi:hypothetical protein
MMVITEGRQPRFLARIRDPLRQWKSYRRWYDYSHARDLMLNATGSAHAPWNIVRSDDKRRARLNCIAHILSMVGRLRRQRYWLAKLAKFCPAAALLPPRSSHVKMACWAKQGWGGVDEFRRTIQAHTPPGH